MFNKYSGSINNWLNYVYHYMKVKAEKRLYERYVANYLGKLIGAGKSYDDFLEELDNATSGKKKRTAKEIRQDFLIKFGKGE